MLQIVATSLTIVIDNTRRRLGSSITITYSFIIQANVITIVNYERKTFIVQATGVEYRPLPLFTVLSINFIFGGIHFLQHLKEDLGSIS